MTGRPLDIIIERNPRVGLIFFAATALSLVACDTDKLNLDEMLDGVVDPDDDEDGYTVGDGDCNDEDPAINPGASEYCDGIDNDCNNKIDNGMLSWKWEKEEVKWLVGPGVETLTIDQDDRGWDSDNYLADGIADDRHVITFDGNGIKLFHEIDENIDGEMDFKVSYIYTGAGLISLEQYDRNADGSIEKSVAYTYESGTLVKIETDNGNDGDIDSSEVWNYDERGDIESHEFDSNGDGEADGGKYYNYDESGLLISTVDRDEDGQQTWSLYTWSEDGELLHVDSDSSHDSDADLDTRTFVADDAENNQKIIQIDHGIDGVIDEIHTEKYDDEGRLRAVEKDYDIDGSPDHLLSLVYGDEGLVVMESEDLLNGNEESFEADHDRANKWETTRTISFNTFDAMIERKLEFECEAPETVVEVGAAE